MPRRRGGKKHKKKPMATCPICYEREPEMFFECDRCNYKMCSHCSNKLQTAVWTKRGIGTGIKCPCCRNPQLISEPTDYPKYEYSNLKHLMGLRDSNEMELPLVHLNESGEIVESDAKVLFRYIPCSNDQMCRGCNESEIKTYVDGEYVAWMEEMYRKLRHEASTRSKPTQSHA